MVSEIVMKLLIRAALAGLLAVSLAACSAAAPRTDAATAPPAVTVRASALEKAEASFEKACDYSRLAMAGWGLARLFVKLSEKDLATADWAVDLVSQTCANPPELRTVAGWTAAAARLDQAVRKFKASRDAAKREG
jgi:hypothetical protein